MRKERKHFTPEEKVAILRRHLVDKVPVSELCEELGLRPTVFYRWQKELFENGAAAFQSQERPHRQVEEKQKRIEFLEKKVQTKDEVLAELMAEHNRAKKKSWGTLTGIWVQHDVRDLVVDFVRRWSEKAEIGVGRFIPWLGVTASKFYDWRQRYGCVNEHNGWVPRDFWLEPWEKEAIIGFHLQNPLEGYRRLTFMMLDADVVAVSPASVWRVLKQAGLLSRWKSKPSRKGTGFEQPLQPHQHWHIDVSYINLCGTFYYLCSILDGFSRFLVHWDLRESMREADVEVILQRAKEKYPEAKPRIISDNGPQFIARDFKEFIRISGMTHVRTSPYYPQSNGKIERWHKSLKSECIRPGTPLSLEDARRLVESYVEHYNNVRLNSATGYVTPKDVLAGRQQEIHAERDRKLEAARQQRRSHRQQAA
jgi:transposase InsO family protein/transposase-like protein